MYNFYLYHKDLKKPIRITDPAGWDSLGKSLKRDPKLHGVFFEYTPKLKFVKDGKAIIHTLYERYWIEAEIILIVKVYDPTLRQMVLDYRGRINLTTLEVSRLYATCNVENTGFLQKFKNRSDVKVNLFSEVSQDGTALPAFNNSPVTVNLPSKTIKKVVNAVKGDSDMFDEGFLDNSGAAFFRDIKIGLFDVNIVELDGYNGAFSSFSSDIVALNGYLFPIIEGGSYSFDFNIELSLSVTIDTFDNPLANQQFDFLWGSKNDLTNILSLNLGPNDYDSTSTDLPLVTFTKNFTISRNEILNLEPGDDIYLYCASRINFDDAGNGPAQYAGEITSGYFNVEALTTSVDTTAPLILPHEMYSRICQSITDQPDAFRSDYYGRQDSEPVAYGQDGPGALRSRTNGKLLRGFPIEDNEPHQSWSGAYASAQAIDGVGAGLEVVNNYEVIRMEPLGHFYKNEEIVRLNWVEGITKKVATDYIYNELDCGYKKWANEEFNNLDEFNTRQDRVLPVTQLKKELSLVSPDIGSGYTLEFTKRDRYQEASTRDNDNDNEIFVIQLRRSGGGFIVDRDEDFTTLTGVIDPGTVYNAKISVARNILRNGAQIAASLYLLNGSINLAFSEGNSTLVTQLAGEAAPLAESDPIPASMLERALWRPEEYGFKHKPNWFQRMALYANPTGYVSFSETDKNHKKGYILELVPDQSTREIDFTLLRANL
ncbi:MAG: hypothetical protein ACFB2Y_16975 [Fulvivirga sp.]